MECIFVHLQISCEDFVKNIIDWLQSSIPCDDNIECPRELVEQMAVPVGIIEKADLEYDLMLGLLAHLDHPGCRPSPTHSCGTAHLSACRR